MLSSKHSTEVNRFSFQLLSTWLDVEQYGTHLIVVSSPIQLQIGEHPHFSNFSRNGSWSPKRGIPLPHKCQQSKPTCWGQACPQAGLKEVPHGCQVSMWGEFSCLQTTRSVFQRGGGGNQALAKIVSRLHLFWFFHIQGTETPQTSSRSRRGNKPVWSSYLLAVGMKCVPGFLRLPC